MLRTDVHETAAIGYIFYLGFAVVSPVMQDVVFSQHSLDHPFKRILQKADDQLLCRVAISVNYG